MVETKRDLSIFNVVGASQAAPTFCPDSWNDLGIDAKENVRRFFSKLRESCFGAVSLLQSSSLLYLGALLMLCDDESDTPSINKQRIERILSKSDIDKILNLLKEHFSSQQTRANCYAYAINFREGKIGAKPDPGGKTQEFKCRLYDTYRDAIVAGAIDDGLLRSGTVIPSVREGFYRAALFIREGDGDQSFHWVREDAGGKSWSHKEGHNLVTNTDKLGMILTNPERLSLSQYKLTDYFYIPKDGVQPAFHYSGL